MHVCAWFVCLLTEFSVMTREEEVGGMLSWQRLDQSLRKLPSSVPCCHWLVECDFRPEKHPHCVQFQYSGIRILATVSQLGSKDETQHTYDVWPRAGTR